MLSPEASQLPPEVQDLDRHQTAMRVAYAQLFEAVGNGTIQYTRDKSKTIKIAEIQAYMRLAHVYELPFRTSTLEHLIPKRKTDFFIAPYGIILDKAFHVKLINAQATEPLRQVIQVSQPIGLKDGQKTVQRKAPLVPLIFQIENARVHINAFFRQDVSIGSTIGGGTVLEEGLRVTLGALFLFDAPAIESIKNNGLLIATRTDRSKVPLLADVLIPRRIAQAIQVPQTQKEGLYHLVMDRQYPLAPKVIRAIQHHTTPAAVILTG